VATVMAATPATNASEVRGRRSLGELRNVTEPR
jgi:hypothetical protein